MQNLKNVDLLTLQTRYMQQDPTTKALCAALTPLLQDLAEKVKLCLVLPNVDTLPEEILDELAYELHVEWYDANASTEVKRSLIKNSDKVHKYLGTPYAVEQVVQDYFGDGTVKEWFEYEGDPYNFRVVTSNSAVTGDLANQFAKAVDKVKRKSTRLEQVIMLMSAGMDLYLGNVLHTGDYYTIRQEA